MKKKTLTPEMVYKRNERKAKAFRILSPIVRWGLLALAIYLLFLAIKNSFGNIGEIIDLLDGNVYTGEELKANYAYLMEKYGEWQIGTGGSGFSILFINIKNAVFSGFMVTTSICSLISFVGSFVFGKWFFPFMAKHIEQDNKDMVNLTILKKE